MGNRNIKVLFTVIDYYPKVSGVPVVTQYLAEGLAAKGYRVLVATGKVENSPKRETMNGVHIRRFDIHGSAYHIPTGECKAYIKWVLRQDIDLMINVCKPVWPTTLLLPVLDQIKCKKLLHSHGANGLYMDRIFEFEGDLKHTVGHTYRYFAARYFFGNMLPKYLRSYDGVLCLTEKTGKEYPYFRKHMNKNRIVELGNAADHMFFSEDIKVCISDYVQLYHTQYCINIANYTEVKNQICLLREFYRSNVLNMDLVLVGKNFDHYYERMCRVKDDLDKRFGKRYVHFIQTARRCDIPGLLKGAQIYICSSKLERYSISLIEAMACGVPFISTDVGNAASLPGGIVTQENRIHVAIQELCSDPARRKMLGAAGHRYSRKNCRIEQKIDQLDECITNMRMHGEIKNG